MQKLVIDHCRRSGSRDDLVSDIGAVADGDVDAFIRVYRATSAKLFGVVVRILGRGDLAEEILQEVYLRIWQKAADFDPARASPITWLATIARNRALDEGRRRRMGSIEDMPELLEIPSGEDIAGDHLALDELRHLNVELARLDPQQRRVIDLIYFQGLTRDEVAQLIGSTTSAVNTLLRKALAELRTTLEP